MDPPWKHTERTRVLCPLPLSFLEHHCRSFTCFQRDCDSVFTRHPGLFSCCKRDTAEWPVQLTRWPSDIWRTSTNLTDTDRTVTTDLVVTSWSMWLSQQPCTTWERSPPQSLRIQESHEWWDFLGVLLGTSGRQVILNQRNLCCSRRCHC